MAMIGRSWLEDHVCTCFASITYDDVARFISSASMETITKIQSDVDTRKQSIIDVLCPDNSKWHKYDNLIPRYARPDGLNYIIVATSKKTVYNEVRKWLDFTWTDSKWIDSSMYSVQPESGYPEDTFSLILKNKRIITEFNKKFKQFLRSEILIDF